MTTQLAFFCAGQAIGLREIGAPADVLLRDAPKMKPQAAEAWSAAPQVARATCNVSNPAKGAFFDRLV
jgi:hypothetical protein